MTEYEKVQKYGPVVAVLESRSQPGKAYAVRRSIGGDYSCQCPGYRFRRDCKHIDAVRRDLVNGVDADGDFAQCGSSPKEVIVGTFYECGLSGEESKIDSFASLVLKRLDLIGKQPVGKAPPTKEVNGVKVRHIILED